MELAESAAVAPNQQQRDGMVGRVGLRATSASARSMLHAFVRCRYFVMSSFFFSLPVFSACCVLHVQVMDADDHALAPRRVSSRW